MTDSASRLIFTGRHSDNVLRYGTQHVRKFRLFSTIGFAVGNIRSKNRHFKLKQQQKTLFGGCFFVVVIL